MVESGDQVIVTYESETAAGKRGRNTEVLTFRDGQVQAAEVYFGWDVSAGRYASGLAFPQP